MNEDKCHLLITNQENKPVSAIIAKETIKNSESVKLFGITIDNKLRFDKHVAIICKKVNVKLHALARISNLMSTNKLRIIMKSFIESQFGYCPLVWMFHSKTLNNKINKLHERVLRLVYKDYNLSFGELLIKDRSVTIHQRNLQKLAIEMYKLANNITPTLMKAILPELSNPYNLRSGNPFQTYNVRTVKYLYKYMMMMMMMVVLYCCTHNTMRNNVLTSHLSNPPRLSSAAYIYKLYCRII